MEELNQKESVDLSGALSRQENEFEKPSTAGGNNLNTPKIVLWAIRKSGGIIKTEKQATLILIIASILIIALSIVLPVSQNTKPMIVPSPVGDNPLLK
ncbi:MAG: hypothetical protein V1905_00330 [bacterium]